MNGSGTSADVEAWFSELGAHRQTFLLADTEIGAIPTDFPIVFSVTGGMASTLQVLNERSGAKRRIVINQGRENELSASLQMPEKRVAEFRSSPIDNHHSLPWALRKDYGNDSGVCPERYATS